jgi:voltage-gated potassium channel
VVELVWGLNRALWLLGQAIWMALIAEFAVALALAPAKLRYVRQNWLKALALAAPALRVLRLARLVRVARIGGATRGLRLLRIVGSVNRSMNALGAAMQRRGFALTFVVTLAGAAGMYALERDAPGGGFDSYFTALSWTAMVMTTMGSEYWPASADGRVLCFFLALYAFAIFGYVTAVLATFFIGRDSQHADTERASLAAEIAALRQEVRSLSARLAER